MIALLMFFTHLVALFMGCYLYKTYAAKAIAEAVEAKEWAEKVLADYKASLASVSK